MLKRVLNIPPPLPLMRTSNVYYDHKYINADVYPQPILHHMDFGMTKDEHRKQQGGFIDIDHPRNVSIPLKLNRQVTV